VSRAQYNVNYPAGFMLVASMNPCPCGYYNDPSRQCVCTPGQVQKYMNRISGPLLDRIDLQVEIVPVPFEKLSGKLLAESSKIIRERVTKARNRQEERFRQQPGTFCNARMTAGQLRNFALPDKAGMSLLKNAMAKLNLSARAYERILKVSRTIADLEGSGDIQAAHVAEAIQYRMFDRSKWGV
jgi:magnesium chelatase family protein